jgi:sulfatase maturation enzyme AslB (radical SAM superfamily)
MNNLKNKFCKNPWDFFLIGTNYSTQCCYIHTNIGQIKTNDIFDVWNSDLAQDVRKSILDGTFSHCKKEICPSIQDGTLPDRNTDDPYIRTIIDNYILTTKEIPSYIHLCNDLSCNLECPSCRKEKVRNFFNEKDFKVNKEFLDNLLINISSNPHKEILINITGSGDPFASKLYREFLFSIDGDLYPNLKIGLQTNGTMMTPKYWNMIQRIHKNISHVLISIDAGCKETYDKVRVGGNWNILNENIRFLKNFMEENNLYFYTELSFILQQKNYRDLPLFAKLAHELNYTAAVSLIYPWYSSAFFKEAMVYEKDHPEYKSLLEVLRDPIFEEYPIKWGNVTPYREIALHYE